MSLGKWVPKCSKGANLEICLGQIFISPPLILSFRWEFVEASTCTRRGEAILSSVCPFFVDSLKVFAHRIRAVVTVT